MDVTEGLSNKLKNFSDNNEQFRIAYKVYFFPLALNCIKLN